MIFLSPAAVANVVATSGALSPADLEALDGVRTFLSAGAPVAPPLVEAAARLMPNATAHTPYGMTEGLLMTDVTLDEIHAVAASAPGDAARSGGGVCVGRAAAGVRIRVSALDADGHATGALTESPDLTGEIVVAAPHVMDHYDRLWLTDRASRRVSGARPGERWHRTGDVGHLDRAGRLWVEGRLPHVITTADGVVTPVAVEQGAESASGVARAAAVGVGPSGTQQVVVVAETSPPSSRVQLAGESLAASIRAAAGVPLAAVILVPRLPTDVRHNSKIDRSGLAAWASRLLRGENPGRPA